MNSYRLFLASICATLFISAGAARAAAPPAPDYVNVSWLDNTDQFLVRWFPVTGATSYNVYRYDTNTSAWTAVATNLSFELWNVSSFRHSASPDSGPGTYSVTAVNGDGESAGTSAMATPGNPLSIYSCQSDYWPRGYTFLEINCTGSWMDGSMGMVEASTDGVNFTHGAWSTNITTLHILRVTNLPPQSTYTIYYTRLTFIDTNGSGFSEIFPWWGTYTLPVTNIDVWEDMANGIEIGDSTWYNPAQIVTPPAHGTLVPGDFAYKWIYTPNPDFAGLDSIEILDNPAGPPITITLNVQNVNEPPVAQPFTVYMAEDSEIVITPVVFDAENDPVQLYMGDSPLHAGTFWNDFTSFTYAPAPDFVGTDQWTFLAHDPYAWNGQYVTGTVIVTNVNDAPVASDQSFNTTEDTPATFTVQANDIDSGALTVIIIDPPLNGSVTNTGMAVTYTPAADFSGADAFSFRVSDSQANSEMHSISIQVTAVNDPPVAQPPSVTVSEDDSVSIPLPGSDVDGDALTFVVLTSPEHGELLNGVYSPAANYFGQDSFTYKANDGQLDSAPATVTITVTPVNDQPVADSKSVSTPEDQSVAIALTGSDIDGDGLTFVVVTEPAHGTFANGIYTPAANYNGPDSFTYKANDGQADSALATVEITVIAVNDAPVANNQSVSTPYNTTVNITLSGSDLEGSALSYTTLTAPANGTLSGTGANRTFAPNIGWSGTTSFTFKANDGELDSAPSTVSITVVAPGSVPAAPGGLTASAVSRSQINLAWNDNSSNEDGFKIERSANGSSGWTQIATVGPNVTTYSNTGLSKNTRYYYRVRAHNVLGNSSYSNTANARTLN